MRTKNRKSSIAMNRLLPYLAFGLILGLWLAAYFRPTSTAQAAEWAIRVACRAK